MVTPLQNATALLTGASRGLGPYIARALASQGVRLALAARSPDELQRVAEQAQELGVHAVAIPCDLTAPGQRDRLLDRAEAALGPLDILINNAGVENGARFVSKSPGELEQIIATNLTANVLLSRQALDGMLARRRGHIINMASISGKLSYPYAALYGGSKAALLWWSLALRAELHGTGVSVSTVAPGWVLETGMFARHRIRPHRLIGATTPEAVAQAVVRVLQKDLPEVVVNSLPVWPFQILLALAPGLMLRSMRRLGLVEYTRQVEEGQQNLQD